MKQRVVNGTTLLVGLSQSLYKHGTAEFVYIIDLSLYETKQKHSFW